jgi:hypothetical protein
MESRMKWKVEWEQKGQVLFGAFSAGDWWSKTFDNEARARTFYGKHKSPKRLIAIEETVLEEA